MTQGPKPLRIVRSSGEGSPYPKCSLLLRGSARIVDVLIAYGLFRLTGQMGEVLALLWVLFSDGMFIGQSPGKKIFGIKVVELPRRAPARYRESTLRNAPFALVILLGMLPPPLGKVAFLAASVVIGGVEAWKVVREPLGLRFGDVWAQTQVVDGKVASGVQARPSSVVEPTVAGRTMCAAVPCSGADSGRIDRCGLR